MGGGESGEVRSRPSATKTHNDRQVMEEGTAEVRFALAVRCGLVWFCRTAPHRTQHRAIRFGLSENRNAPHRRVLKSVYLRWLTGGGECMV